MESVEIDSVCTNYKINEIFKDPKGNDWYSTQLTECGEPVLPDSYNVYPPEIIYVYLYLNN